MTMDNHVRYCDEQFVKAQARELAEAANMSNQQFNSAARQLLERERAGEIELPMTNRGTYRRSVSRVVSRVTCSE